MVNSPVLKNLDDQSIKAIAEYIDELKTEIKRAEECIDKKQAAKKGADSFFN